MVIVFGWWIFMANLSFLFGTMFLGRSNDSTPDDDNEVLYEWEDDPYFAQIQAFVSDVEGGNTQRVLSKFEDALQTYEFTWAIRTASENK